MFYVFSYFSKIKLLFFHYLGLSGTPKSSAFHLSAFPILGTSARIAGNTKEPLDN
jgi:hypothetical protein